MKVKEMIIIEQMIKDLESEIVIDRKNLSSKERKVRTLKGMLEPAMKEMHERAQKKLDGTYE